jgi:hypothetical protein
MMFGIKRARFKVGGGLVETNVCCEKMEDEEEESL